jgi:hypothetical protein
VTSDVVSAAASAVAGRSSVVTRDIVGYLLRSIKLFCIKNRQVRARIVR